MSRPPAISEAIAETIAKDIAGLPIGDWLPGRRRLAKDYGVSEDTIARALRLLVARHALEFVAGQGHRIPRPQPLRRASSDQTEVVGGWRGWHAVCLAAGREPWTDSVPREAPLPAHAAPWLAIPAGELVVERARTQGWVEAGVRRPVVLSWTWIHPTTVKELPILRLPNTGPGGLTSRLVDAGHRPWWEEIVRARPADPDETQRLRLAAGAAVLDVWRRCWDADGDRVLEATRRVINSDLHELVYRYP